PATAKALRVASDIDTVMWYKGQSPAITAAGLGRLGISTDTDTVTLARKMPLSDNHGFQILESDPPPPGVVTTFDPNSTSMAFNTAPDPTVAVGEKVEITLREPDGTTRVVSLTAVSGKAGPGQF